MIYIESCLSIKSDEQHKFQSHLSLCLTDWLLSEKRTYSFIYAHQQRWKMEVKCKSRTCLLTNWFTNTNMAHLAKLSNRLQKNRLLQIWEDQSHIVVNSVSHFAILSLFAIFKFPERRSVFSFQNRYFWHNCYTLNTGLTCLHGTSKSSI